IAEALPTLLEIAFSLLGVYLVMPRARVLSVGTVKRTAAIARFGSDEPFARFDKALARAQRELVAPGWVPEVEEPLPGQGLDKAPIIGAVKLDGGTLFGLLAFFVFT